MLKVQSAIAASLLALTLGAGTVSAQLTSEPPTTQIDQSFVGRAIVSSDGQRIGQVTAVGLDAGQPVLVGDIERSLGFGADPVAIPPELFVNKGDYIELTITAAEVRDRLARPH
jgi:PRC-barrel domain protein